jgi:hypothetical protein
VVCVLLLTRLYDLRYTTAKAVYKILKDHVLAHQKAVSIIWRQIIKELDYFSYSVFKDRQSMGPGPDKPVCKTRKIRAHRLIQDEQYIIMLNINGLRKIFFDKK